MARTDARAEARGRVAAADAVGAEAIAERGAAVADAGTGRGKPPPGRTPPPERRTEVAREETRDRPRLPRSERRTEKEERRETERGWETESVGEAIEHFEQIERAKSTAARRRSDSDARATVSRRGAERTRRIRLAL